MQVFHGVGAACRASHPRVCLAILVALSLGGAACSSGGPASDATPAGTSGPDTPAASTSPSPPDCPAADGVGSTAPTIAVYSITFLVNGSEQTVDDGEVLRAGPGDRVLVSSVTICASSVGSGAGQACVDVAPRDANGDAIRSQAWGSHLRDVSEGFTTIAGPSRAWTVDEARRGFIAVVNHWPEGPTADSGCADRQCERDDYLIVPLG